MKDFENDASLTEKQKKRRREYYADRERNCQLTKIWRQSHPERRRELNKNYIERNRDRLSPVWRERAKQWQRAHPETVKASTLRNKEKQKEWSKNRAISLKQQVMSAYGGYCTCCGESQIEFLSIDHIRNDGKKWRAEGKHSLGTNFYFQLKKQGYPKENLQILCYNCNLGKHYHGGVCPHQRRAEETLMNWGIVA